MYQNKSLLLKNHLKFCGKSFEFDWNDVNVYMKTVCLIRNIFSYEKHVCNQNIYVKISVTSTNGGKLKCCRKI